MDNPSKTPPHPGVILPNTVEEIVVKYRPPSEEGSPVQRTSSPHYGGIGNNIDAPWGPWSLGHSAGDGSSNPGNMQALSLSLFLSNRYMNTSFFFPSTVYV